MSKPRYIWWSYVKAMIRRYPQLAQEYAELKEVPTTAPISGMPKGNNISDKTANIALRELPATRQAEYDAVRRAIETTAYMETGEQRLELVRLVFWNQTHTVIGAGMVLGISEATAKRYHGEFIRMVAIYYGFLEKNTDFSSP